MSIFFVNAIKTYEANLVLLKLSLDDLDVFRHVGLPAQARPGLEKPHESTFQGRLVLFHFVGGAGNVGDHRGSGGGDRGGCRERSLDGKICLLTPTLFSRLATLD